jgi:hypothetical protein
MPHNLGEIDSSRRSCNRPALILETSSRVVAVCSDAEKFVAREYCRAKLLYGPNAIVFLGHRHAISSGHDVCDAQRPRRLAILGGAARSAWTRRASLVDTPRSSSGPT